MFRRLIAKLTRKPAPATVAEILAPYGVDPAADHGFLIKVGRAAAAIYAARYGAKPAQVPAAAPNGRAITVAGYSAADHWMVVEAFCAVGLAEFEAVTA